MGKYIHYFESESDFTNKYNGEEYLEPWVSLTDVREPHVDYNRKMAYVDLGLPSRCLWGAYNLGAPSSGEPGDYYAWAELETKDYFSRNTYKYYDAENVEYTKYANGRDTTLLLEDDAARLELGEGWYVPTKEDFQELMNNCTFSTYTGGDITYLKATSNINGKSINFINTGYYNQEGSLTGQDFFYLWAANDVWGDCSQPYYELVNIFKGDATDNYYAIDDLPRYRGAQIRPVWKPAE